MAIFHCDAAAGRPGERGHFSCLCSSRTTPGLATNHARPWRSDGPVLATPHVMSRRVAYACVRMTHQKERKNISKNRGRRRRRRSRSAVFAASGQPNRPDNTTRRRRTFMSERRVSSFDGSRAEPSNRQHRHFSVPLNQRARQFPRLSVVGRVGPGVAQLGVSRHGGCFVVCASRSLRGAKKHRTAVVLGTSVSIRPPPRASRWSARPVR